MHFTGGKPQGSLGKKFRNQAQQNCHSVTSLTGFACWLQVAHLRVRIAFTEFAFENAFFLHFSFCTMNPNLKLTLENIRVRGLSAFSAAIKYSVSKTTILRRLDNPIPGRRGRPQLFTRDQEDLFYQVAKRFEDHGRPIEINDFLKMVREYAAKKGWFEAVMLTFFGWKSFCSTGIEGCIDADCFGEDKRRSKRLTHF